MTLLPNSIASGNFWITKKMGSFTFSQYDHYALYAKSGTDSSASFAISGTVMDIRADAKSFFFRNGMAYSIIYWDTSKSGSSGQYYAISGKTYRGVINFIASGEVVGSASYLQVTVKLRTSSTIYTSTSLKLTSDYDGYFSIVTDKIKMPNSVNIYMEISVKAFAYTPGFGPFATSNAQYNSFYHNPGYPDYNVTLTSFSFQQEYNLF